MAIQIGFEIDVSGFAKGMQQIKKSTLTMATEVTTVMRNIASGIQSAAGVVESVASKMFEAMGKGGELANLSEQTGVSVDKLMLLRLAFDQAGVGADAVGSVINRMQNAIVNAAAGSLEGQATFQALGLSLEDLSKQDAATQLQSIGDAIMKIEDPMKRAAVAQDLFGQSGGRLLARFKTGGLDEAAKTLGNQAQIMRDNAGYFDEITSKFSAANLKLQGLFVGMAANLVPDLLDAANKLNELDFNDIGLSVGTALATMVDFFTSGTISDAFYIGLRLAVMKLINFFVQSFINAVALIEAPVVALFEFIVSTLEDPLRLAFAKAGAVLLEAAGKTLEMIGTGLQKFSSTREIGKSVTQTGINTQWKAIDMETAAENIGKNMGGFSDVMAKAKSNAMNTVSWMFDQVQGIDLFSNQSKAELEELRRLWMQSQKAATDARAKLGPATPMEGKGNGLTVIPPERGRGQSFEAITSSMARIGGGGLTAGVSFTVSPIVDQQKETNRLLKEQNAMIARGSVGVAKLAN